MSSGLLMILYIALTTAISVIAARYLKGSKSFFTAQGELGMILLVPFVFAEVTAGAGTIGSAQTGFTLGMSAVWAKAGMALGFVFFGLFIAKFFYVMNRQRGVITVAAAFSERFDVRSRYAMMFITAISYFIIFSVQPIAGALIIAPILGTHLQGTAWVIGIIFLTVACTGGLKGVAWMNLVHAFIMFFGIMGVSLVGIKSAGGVAGLREALPREMFSLLQPNGFTAFAWAVAAIISVFTASTSVTAVFSAKTLKTARYGSALAGIMMIPFAVILVMSGMAAKVVTPDIESGKALFAIANYVGPTGLTVVCVAMAAAIFSTGPAYILLPATTLVRDLYVPLFNKNASDRSQMIASRIIIIVMGAVFIYMGTKASSILSNVLGALQIRSVASIILIIGLLVPRFNASGAFWAILVSGSVSAVWYITGNPFGVEPLWPALATLLPIVVFSLFNTSNPVSEGFEKYRGACISAKDTNQI